MRRRALLIGGLVAACAPAPAPPSLVTLDAVDRAVLDAINDARTGSGLATLRRSAALDRAAAGHAAAMAEAGQLSHGLNGRGPAQRVGAEGYRYRWLGENIARIAQGQDAAVAAGLVSSWLGSPPHASNIFDENAVDTGLGTVARAGEVFAVQLFGRPF